MIANAAAHPSNKVLRTLERGRSILLGLLATVAGAVFLMLKMDGGS